MLLVPKLAESLAGRMEILRLYPLAQCELACRVPRFLDTLLAGEGTAELRRPPILGLALLLRTPDGLLKRRVCRPPP